MMNAGKPVVAMGDAVKLLADNELLTGREVAAPDAVKGDVERSGATLPQNDVCTDGNLVTGEWSDALAEAMKDAIAMTEEVAKAA
jgi:hypothetical protein